jgi:hypothetical protein
MYEYVLIPLILFSLTMIDCSNREPEEVEEEKVEEDGYIERVRKNMYFQNLEY